MGKNIVLVYTCTALIIREIYTCTVSTLRGIKGKHSHPINCSQFTFEKTVANTSPTLLALVSQLVSNGEVNKSAVTTSQCIQQHISNSTNKTTLGLAL